MSVFISTWKSPSNIALVKYWGKKPNAVQLPANASISFTLRSCATTTKLTFSEQDALEIHVQLDGNDQPSFVPKIEDFIKRISSIFPFTQSGKYTIETSNSFPHSSGIASSASGMSALSLCICDIARKKGLLVETDFLKTASILSRLGSGSASRSVYGPLAVWGSHPNFDSSDEFAIPYTDVHPVFTDYRDTILLVHKGQKSVSSTVGHNLVNDHPFAKARFAQAQNNMVAIKEVLKRGDLDDFIKIVENEALSLHSLMLSSDPSFILMKPNTLSILEKIRQVRDENDVKWCFTLDAGANVHFLYPKADEQKALDFVDNELKRYCQNGAYICDQVGLGPTKQ